MNCASQTFDLKPQDVTLIKAALETQRKILHVQVGAGQSSARTKLSEIRRIQAKLGIKDIKDSSGAAGLVHRLRCFFAGFTARRT